MRIRAHSLWGDPVWIALPERRSSTLPSSLPWGGRVRQSVARRNSTPCSRSHPEWRPCFPGSHAGGTESRRSEIQFRTTALAGNVTRREHQNEKPALLGGRLSRRLVAGNWCPEFTGIVFLPELSCRITVPIVGVGSDGLQSFHFPKDIHAFGHIFRCE